MGILQGTGPGGRITLADYAGMTNQTQYLPQNQQPAAPSSPAPTTTAPTAPKPAAQPSGQTQAPMTVSFPQQPSASNPAWPTYSPNIIEPPPPREPDQPSVLQSMMQNPIYSTSGPTTANNTFGSSFSPSQVNANGQIVGSADTRTIDQRNAALMNTTVGGKPGGGTWTMGEALAFQNQQNAPRNQAAAASAAGNPGVLTMSPLGNGFSAGMPQQQQQGGLDYVAMSGQLPPMVDRVIPRSDPSHPSYNPNPAPQGLPDQAPAHFDSIQQGAIQNAQNVDLGQLQRLADDATFQRLTPAQQQEYIGLALAYANPYSSGGETDIQAGIAKAGEMMADKYGYQINAGGVGLQLNPNARDAGLQSHGSSQFVVPDGFYQNLLSGGTQQQQPGMSPGMQPGAGQQAPQGQDYFNNLLQQQLGGLQGQFSQQLGGLQQQFMQYQQEQMAQAKARDEMLERIMQAQLAAQRNAQTQQAIGSGQPVASQRPEDVNRANAPSYLTPLSTQNRANSLSRYLAAQMAV